MFTNKQKVEVFTGEKWETGLVDWWKDNVPAGEHGWIPIRDVRNRAGCIHVRVEHVRVPGDTSKTCVPWAKKS